MENLEDFLIFVVVLGHTQKYPKTSANAYRMKLIICQLNFIGESLQFGHKFGTCQILEKKRG